MSRSKSEETLKLNPEYKKRGLEKRNIQVLYGLLVLLSIFTLGAEIIADAFDQFRFNVTKEPTPPDESLPQLLLSYETRLGFWNSHVAIRSFSTDRRKAHLVQRAYKASQDLQAALCDVSWSLGVAGFIFHLSVALLVSSALIFLSIALTPSVLLVVTSAPPNRSLQTPPPTALLLLAFWFGSAFYAGALVLRCLCSMEMLHCLKHHELSALTGAALKEDNSTAMTEAISQSVSWKLDAGRMGILLIALRFVTPILCFAFFTSLLVAWMFGKPE